MRYTATYSNGWTFEGKPGQSLAAVREKASTALAALGNLRIIAVIGTPTHVVAVTLDSTGYGSDTWKCSCGARNESSFGGRFPHGDHITDGSEPVVTYVLSEED